MNDFDFDVHFYCFRSFFASSQKKCEVLVTCDKTRWCIKGHDRLNKEYYVYIFHLSSILLTLHWPVLPSDWTFSLSFFVLKFSFSIAFEIIVAIEGCGSLLRWAYQWRNSGRKKNSRSLQSNITPKWNIARFFPHSKIRSFVRNAWVLLLWLLLNLCRKSSVSFDCNEQRNSKQRQECRRWSRRDIKL